MESNSSLLAEFRDYSQKKKRKRNRSKRTEDESKGGRGGRGGGEILIRGGKKMEEGTGKERGEAKWHAKWRAKRVNEAVGCRLDEFRFKDNEASSSRNKGNRAAAPVECLSRLSPVRERQVASFSSFPSLLPLPSLTPPPASLPFSARHYPHPSFSPSRPRLLPTAPGV